MAREEVKLLGYWASPFVLRVEWALKLKGVDYEFIEEDIFNKSPLLLELNPVHKMVPVLVHEGKPILESTVILEYIDETWKQTPLLPQDPYDRAIVRFWAKFSEEKLSEAAKATMFCQGDEKEKATQLAKFMEGMEKIEGEIKGKSFFGGETIGYLDLSLAWISHWLPVWEEVGSTKIMDPLKFPAITSWVNNFLNHPVIKDKLPPRDEMVVNFRKRVTQMTVAAKHGCD